MMVLPKTTWASLKRRPGVGSDVEVLRLAAEKEVADAAADEVGLEAGVGEPVEHLEGLGRDVLARNVVVGAVADDHRGGLLEKGKHDIK